MKFYQNTTYQSDKVILLEFLDTELYKNHYISLYSSHSHIGFKEFEKILNIKNKAIVESLQNLEISKFYLNIDIAPMKPPATNWIIPWIEYVDDEFLCTLFPEIKGGNNSNFMEKPKTVLTKSVYFFIDYKKEIEFFLNFTESTLLFYKLEGFKIPVTLRFLTGVDCLILRLEVVQYELDFNKINQKELDEYNFAYFCQTLKNFWTIIEEINYKITPREFNDLFIKVLKRQVRIIC